MPSDLFDAFKNSLPQSEGANIYNNVFTQNPPISNLSGLIDTPTEDLGDRSKNAVDNNGAGLYFIDKFMHNATDGGEPCLTNNEWMSMVSAAEEDKAFNSFLDELIANDTSYTPTTGSPVTFNDKGDMLRYLKTHSGETSNFRSWLDALMKEAPCYSVLHQQTAQTIKDTASAYLSNVTETKPYTLQLPIDGGAIYNQGYSVALTDPVTGDLIVQLALNADLSIDFSSTMFNSIAVGSADQPSFNAKISMVDAEGNVVHTFDNGTEGPGNEYIFSIPNDNTAITLPAQFAPFELTAQLVLPIVELTVDFFASIAVYIDIDIAFSAWVAADPNFKNPSYILQNPGALVAAAAPADKVYAEKVEALAYISLVAFDSITAAVLVESGVRDIIDISDKRQEDIVAIEDIDAIDNQVGDYQLFEAYEMASMAANLLDNQTFEWSTDYDNA